MKKLPGTILGMTIALAFGAAQAQVTQIDLASTANASYNIDGPVGTTAGNTGTPLSALTFTLLDPSIGNNVWVGDSTGASIDLHPNVYGASAVYSLLNTLYGQAGLATVSLEFKGSAGADQTFVLYGDSDVRDYNNWVWTNNINGTTTQEWWTNNFSPTPQDQTHRWDSQIYSLAPSFATQTLTDIIVTAGSAGGNYSEPMLAALDVQVAAVPEPSSLALWAIGLAGMVALGSSRRRAEERRSSAAIAEV